MVTIQLVDRSVSEGPKMFSVGLLVETPEAKGRGILSPSVANVTINGKYVKYAVGKDACCLLRNGCGLLKDGCGLLMNGCDLLREGCGLLRD